MSSVAATAEAPADPSPRALKSNTLAESVAILLVMTVVQRLVGFMRGMLFCRWLDPEQLGVWDVAFGFLQLAAPLAVLGLPGSFGRYAEQFRSRGQLRLFLRRTTTLSAAMGLVTVATIICFRPQFSQLIFGTPDQAALVVWVALALAMLIVHNFLVSLFIAVRMYRVVTGLQFLQSLAFAVLSIGLLAAWQCNSTSVVASFGAACVISMIGAIVWLSRIWRESPESGELTPQRDFWAKLIPFAAWVWLTNLLANLFEVIDRYMIIHHSGLDVNEALRTVGYYHSSRIIPLLFVAIAGLLGSLITPHLSHDWEAGKRQQVSTRLNMVIKSMNLVMLAGGIVVLLVAPYLFEYAFRSKFTGGLEVLPWTLTYCMWCSMIPVLQNYLWCAENARIGSLAFLAGLLLNIALNYFLLPIFGLHGAVWTATAANLLVLLLILAANKAYGMQLDRGLWLVTAAPISLAGGPIVAAVVFLGLIVVCATTDSLLTRDEKNELLATTEKTLHRLRNAGSRNKPSAESSDQRMLGMRG